MEFKEYFCLQIKEWETTLISFIIGDNPYELQMLEYVKKVWGFIEMPQVLHHDDKYYVVKFSNIDEKQNVMRV